MFIWKYGRARLGAQSTRRQVHRLLPMPASSLALVILAGLIHAVWNIAAKKAGGDVRFAAFTGLLMALIWAPLGIWLGWDGCRPGDAWSGGSSP